MAARTSLGPSSGGHSIQQGDRSLDQLCIDTIRTLSMDAVQQANSGHPGTPMALAPVAYTLWQDFLRFDPDDPEWPNRDRFVLSCGHASMLLYSLLHLAGVQADDRGGAAVTLDDIKRFRQLDSPCPGHPEYRMTAGVETTTGPLGQGAATSVGMAIGAQLAGPALQSARLRAVRLRRLRAVQRRRHDGGHLGRGGFHRGPSPAGEPVLDLRFQPHHDRGRDRPRLQRGRGQPVRGLWLGSAPCRRRQRRWSAQVGLDPVPGDPGPADADHRPQPYRLRRTAQAGYPRGPRGAAGRRGSALGQAQLWLARGRQVPGPGRGL